MKPIIILITLTALLGCGKTPVSIPSPQKATPDERESLVQIESMFASYQKSFQDVPYIDPRAADILADKPVLVDVRELQEQDISMIDGAITKDQFEKNQHRYKNRKIVVYCTIGYRSGLYTATIRDQGFNAVNLKGGILLWAHAGKPVSDRNGPTKRTHVYGTKWNLLPTGWDSVID